MDKPVELMTEQEKVDYYMKRRAALLAGDTGVLPNGKTCLEERLEYIAACNQDPFRTAPGVGAAAIFESELPVGAVAPEITETEEDPGLNANKRCC